MHDFFQCMNALMSQLLRSCVENSLEDFAALFEEYSRGNAYEGVYDMLHGLGVETQQHPITVFVVSELFTYYSNCSSWEIL